MIATLLIIWILANPFIAVAVGRYLKARNG